MNSFDQPGYEELPEAPRDFVILKIDGTTRQVSAPPPDLLAAATESIRQTLLPDDQRANGFRLALLRVSGIDAPLYEELRYTNPGLAAAAGSRELKKIEKRPTDHLTLSVARIIFQRILDAPETNADIDAMREATPASEEPMHESSEVEDELKVELGILISCFGNTDEIPSDPDELEDLQSVLEQYNDSKSEGKLAEQDRAYYTLRDSLYTICAKYIRPFYDDIVKSNPGINYYAEDEESRKPFENDPGLMEMVAIIEDVIEDVITHSSNQTAIVALFKEVDEALKRQRRGS